MKFGSLVVGVKKVLGNQLRESVDFEEFFSNKLVLGADFLESNRFEDKQVVEDLGEGTLVQTSETGVKEVFDGVFGSVFDFSRYLSPAGLVFLEQMKNLFLFLVTPLPLAHPRVEDVHPPLPALFSASPLDFLRALSPLARSVDPNPFKQNFVLLRAPVALLRSVEHVFVLLHALFGGFCPQRESHFFPVLSYFFDYLQHLLPLLFRPFVDVWFFYFLFSRTVVGLEVQVEEAVFVLVRIEAHC